MKISNANNFLQFEMNENIRYYAEKFRMGLLVELEYGLRLIAVKVRLISKRLISFLFPVLAGSASVVHRATLF